jgi:hypothetical protein
MRHDRRNSKQTGRRYAAQERASAADFDFGNTAGLIRGPGPSKPEQAARRAAWLSGDPAAEAARAAAAAPAQRRDRGNSKQKGRRFGWLTGSPSGGSTLNSENTAGLIRGPGPSKAEQARRRAAWFSDVGH